MPNDFDFIYTDPIDSINTFDSSFSRQYLNASRINSVSTIYFKLTPEQKEEVYKLIKRYRIDRFDCSNKLLMSEGYAISVKPPSYNHIEFILDKKKYSFGYSIKMAVLVSEEMGKQQDKWLDKQCENLICFDVEMRNLFREFKKKVKLRKTNYLLI